ncbi:MAG: zinc-binding dehydrogenase [Devosia sp.]
MRAQVIHEHGPIEAITFHDDFADPTPGEGEVVLTVGACTLNYHDLFTLKGMPGIKVPMPIIMGIDVAGTVDAVGPGVTDWSVGDRVVVDPIERKAGKLLGEMVNGGLAERVVVTADQLLSIPNTMTFTAAAALPCAYGTAYRMMMTRGHVHPGDKVLVLGASGGVGTCCVQLAKMAGAHVIAAASSQEKLDRLAALGADEGINYAEGDFMREVHARFGKPRISGGGGVDVIVNFTGGDTWIPSLRSLTKGGRLLTCGATAGYDVRSDMRFIWTFEHNILGSNGWSKEDVAELIKLTDRGDLNPIVSSTYPLEDTQGAFRAMEERRVFGKVAVIP